MSQVHRNFVTFALSNGKETDLGKAFPSLAVMQHQSHVVSI